jgi:hypothetical protein
MAFDATDPNRCWGGCTRCDAPFFRAARRLRFRDIFQFRLPWGLVGPVPHPNVP